MPTLFKRLKGLHPPFCIDVTFEMRTVLSQNSFIQLITWKWIPKVIISNRKKGKESKIAERQRESMCERLRIAARGR
jgi:hypothetical protein